MAYQIDRYNKTLLTVVEDGTIDQTTDLNFVGKNYAGYGEIHNENFLFLLENFAGANPPPRAISGQIWFDSSLAKLKFFDGSKWRTTGGAETTGTAPAGLTEGDFWWDTTNEQLYAYNGTDWVLIGPQDAGEGVTQMQSRSIRDNLGVSHSIITSVVNDTVVHIISNDAFTIDNTDAENVIPGFDIVKRGITLVNTQASTGGTTTSEHIFWGTSSNALKLNGIDASQYVTSIVGQATIFENVVQFKDDGFTVGDSNDLQVFVPTGTDNKIAIANTIGNSIFLSAKPAAGTLKNTVRITPDALLPGVTNIEETDENAYVSETVAIGSANFPFNEIFANNFTGLAEKSTALVVNGNNRQGDIEANANTIAVRDNSGDLKANLFIGTALTARYADLAEKYLTDQEYPVGTAMCVGGKQEATAAGTSCMCIGVISDKPAYLMNAEAEGQILGLKGRVPVRVSGPVSKGQPVYAWQDGVCTTIASTGLVGIALESSNEESEKLIECVLKV